MLHARPAAPARDAGIARDAQVLLAAAVQRLREVTGSSSVVAWMQRADGRPYVAAATYEGEPPALPDPEIYRAALALRRATDLRDPAAPPALRAFGEAQPCSAAVSVPAASGRPAAVLLLAAPVPVRPRLLAALDAAAERLRSPLAAARAAERLLALDADVRHLDRLAALGGLAAEIAHEVRNPLVSVKTFLQLLPERRHDAEFCQRFLEVADGELRRVERLLDALLATARPDDAAPSGPTRVGPVVESVLELLRQRALHREVALEQDVTDDVSSVALGEDALRQVLLNLALNALAATPPGGAVRVAARARTGERGVALVVADAGPGVPRERREAIFEPFASSRSERPGGLGLAIVRRIVLDAGGAIRVGDAPGGGAEFRVELPA